MIKQANVTVMVRDMKRAVEFYTKTLGLKLKAQYGKEFAQVEASGTIIALHPASKTGKHDRDSLTLSIGFAVDDLDRTMTELKSKGVKFSKVSDDTQVKLAFFTDPDGNPLYLSQSKWS
jgi:catechol 2,3-dioxygenase-like lactoylglutathione lyase family enzyme